MGNLLSRKGGDDDGDEENSLASSAAESAAKEAMQAVLEEVQKARARQDAGRGAARDPEAAAEVLVAQVLPLSRAQAAAASGAKRGIDDTERGLEPAKRHALDFKTLKDVASSGASAGVKIAADVLVGQEINQEVAAAAAYAGAWIMCYFSLQKGLTPTPNASKYTALLGNLLGGSLLASVPLYHLISGSSNLVKFFAFGGITFGIFAVASGLIVGHFGNTPRSVLYTKIATIAAFVILLTFISAGLCTLLSSKGLQAACGCVCGVFILLLAGFWIHLDR
ncbi:hypothetical protein QOZ80_7BG0587850 [Eleusine coracana subsp. coracana]|nr:hypothetical protein QOZ80_7BG0587850 [Eleusine coracana subsp. coracana]